jgi:hypothetical protein
MAIGTGATIEFFGTQDTVSGTTSAVTNGSFSATADINAWTNDDDAVYASAILSCTFSAAPTANTAVTLYARLMNIQSTNDALVPDANNRHVYLGVFPLNDSTTAQLISIEIPLPNTVTSQVYEFYLQNGAGQTIPAGWALYITPKALGPRA